MKSDSGIQVPPSLRRALSGYARLRQAARYWPLALPALLALLLFLPSVTSDFVWDDKIFLLDLPAYRSPSSWLSAILQPFVLSPNYFRPLALLTFAAQLRVTSNPAAFHLVSVLLHSLNTLLVTLLAYRLASHGRPGTRPGILAPALAAGAIYAIHPALIESVAFVSSRFDLMMTLSLLLAFLADLTLRGRSGRVALVALAFFAALLTKEAALALLLMLPLWHLATAPPGASRFRYLRRRETLEMYAALALVTLTYLGIRRFSLGYFIHPLAAANLDAGIGIQHLLLVGKTLSTLAILAAWPFTTLSPIHYSELPVAANAVQPWLGLALSAALVLGLVLWIRRSPTSGWIAAAGCVGLLPVLNIFPLELGGGSITAERFLTFPLALISLGVCLALLGEAPSTSPAAPRSRSFQWAFIGLWVAAAIITLQLTLPNWRDDLTLWSWVALREPRSGTSFTNLSLEYVKLGRPDIGEQLANHALELDPENGDAWDNLGLALFHSGKYEEAQTAFESATSSQPENALFWNNLAGALREQDKLEEAETILVDKALRLNPALPPAHLNLGMVYLKGNRPDLAAPHLQQAASTLPAGDAASAEALLEQLRDPEVWLRLGELLVVDGDVNGATQAFSQAQALEATEADVAIALSAGLMEIKEWEQAEEVLQAALESFPDDARLHNNLGVVAREQGDTATAREHFARAVELSPSWDLPQQNLDALPASP